MTYEIVRMPTDKAELQAMMEEIMPFLDAMYSETDIKLFGEINFALDYWFFLWDTGAGYFLIKRNAQGELLAVAMITQYTDLWHQTPRVEVHRIALAGIEGLDERAEVKGIIDYMVSVSSLMKFNTLFIVSRDDKGNELKELVWRK